MFWNAALPAFDVITLHSTRSTRLDYSQIRLWGSVGFVVTVLICGVLVERHGATLIHPIVTVLMLGMVALGLYIPDTGHAAGAAPQRGALMRCLRQPNVIALLLAAFLTQLGLRPLLQLLFDLPAGAGLQQRPHRPIVGLWA